jgi:hypothetical protein
MRKLLLAAVAAASVLGSAPAFARPEVCIRQDEIHNWAALNDRQIVLENYHHQKALLDLMGSCVGIQFHEAIAIRSPGGSGLSCIEAGDTIITHNIGMRQRCVIKKVSAYGGDLRPHPYPYSSPPPKGDQH